MTEMSEDELRADPRVSWVEDVLRFGDTDLNGHINNATFAVLCESGRVDFFQSRLVRERDRFFVLARLAIDYRRELTYPGRIRTATWLTRIGRSSLGFSQVLFSEDGQAAATSDAVCVTMDATLRRPVPLSETNRASAGAILRETAM